MTLLLIVVIALMLVVGYVLSYTALTLYVPALFAVASFRGLYAAVAALVLVVLLLLSARRRPVPKVRVLSLSVAFVLFVMLSVTSVLTRAPMVQVSDIPSGGDLRVLSWNTDQRAVPASVVIDLVERTQPDVVVLPEYFGSIAAADLSELVTEFEMQFVADENSAASAFISNRLGKYSVRAEGSAPAWAGFVADPATSSSPTLLFAHLERPNILNADLWRSHLKWVESMCNSTPGLIAAGDFNTTFDAVGTNSLGECSGEALSGSVLAGTWPTALPASLGATIDHVYTGSQWRKSYEAVIDGFGDAGSDHRPIFAVIDTSR